MKDYFRFVLSSYIIQEQIADIMTGARMPRIDEGVFKNIVIPVPPREVQDSISEYLIGQEKKALHFKRESDELQKSATIAFMRTLFY